MTKEMKVSQVRHTLNKMSIEKLLELWEETEKQIMSMENATVREWIMNALEAKNPQAYDNWMNAEYKVPTDDMPRTYFL